MLCLIIGTIVPVLPTTPLLLAGAWFFAPSNQKFHHWLLYHPILGQYIRDYIQKRVVQKSVHNRALLILWSGLLSTMYIVQKHLVIISLAVISSLVPIQLLMLTVLPETTPFDAPEEF